MIARLDHIERRHLALAAAGCAALAVVALVDPSRHAVGPPCPLRALTGLDCPLCGATRATHALLHGQLVRALDFNALYVAALPVVAALGAWWLVRGELPAWARTRVTTTVVLTVAAAFFVLRNLPVPALAALGSGTGGQ